MKIAVISSSVMACPPRGYAGLEMLTWQQAKGLAAKGHQVALIAPQGSTCPGVTIIPTGPPGQWSEDQAYSTYWQHLPQFDCLIDHSVAGDEKLLVRIDGHTKWLSFEELYNWALSKNPVMMDKSGSSEIFVSGLEVPSAENQFSIKWKRVSAVTRHKKKDDLHLVKLRGGHSVITTAGHSLIIANSNGLGVSKASECLHNSVAIAGRIPASKEEMKHWPLSKQALIGCYLSWNGMGEFVEQYRKPILDKLMGDGLKYESAYSTFSIWKKRSVPFDALPNTPESFDVVGYAGRTTQWPIRLDDSDLTFFGLWIGDGCYNLDLSVCLASGIKTKNIGDLVSSKFGAECISDKALSDVRFLINSKLLVAAMKSIGFVGYSGTKSIPDWVFGLSRRQIGLFLRGYFSADGHVKKRICLSSINRNLVDQVSVLLALCGIRCNISISKMSRWGTSDKSQKMYELGIPKDYWRLFLKWVGFVQEDRNRRIKKSILKRRSWRGEIPYCLVRERRFRDGLQEKSISLSKLEKIKGSSVADTYAKSPVSWRKVISSEPQNRQDSYVYDLTVPDTENFFVGLVCCHNSWQKHSYILKMEGRLKAPILGVCHAPVNTMFQKLPNVPHPCFVCISQDQANHFQALFNRKAECAYNGIDTSYYRSIGLERSKRFLFLARFSTIKGPDLAIAACQQTGQELDLVGDTSITNEPEFLKACQDRCDGKQITMIGPASRGECVWYFSKAHCLLHPNERFREPFGLAPVESMACQTPVIAWDNGAMRETIKHGETGWLVNSFDELCLAVQHASQGISDQMRKNCVDWASQFSFERMIDKYEQLCHMSLSSPW